MKNEVCTLKDLHVGSVLGLLSLQWQSFEDLKLTSGLAPGELCKRLVILKRRGLVEKEIRTVRLGPGYWTTRGFWRRTNAVSDEAEVSVFG